MFLNSLLILQGVMLLVLFVVCANSANLLLARATARRREIGVRLALGAGSARIVSMLLAESLVLAGLGAAIGILFAIWGTDALRAVPTYGSLPIRFETSLDFAGLTFALLLALACGVIFGVAPSMQLARTDPNDAIRTGAKSAGRSGMRSTLVAIEDRKSVV